MHMYSSPDSLPEDVIGNSGNLVQIPIIATIKDSVYTSATSLTFVSFNAQSEVAVKGAFLD
jgi:hypothetical protein